MQVHERLHNCRTGLDRPLDRFTGLHVGTPRAGPSSSTVPPSSGRTPDHQMGLGPLAGVQASTLFVGANARPSLRWTRRKVEQERPQGRRRVFSIHRPLREPPDNTVHRRPTPLMMDQYCMKCHEDQSTKGPICTRAHKFSSFSTIRPTCFSVRETRQDGPGRRERPRTNASRLVRRLVTTLLPFVSGQFDDPKFRTTVKQPDGPPRRQSTCTVLPCDHAHQHRPRGNGRFVSLLRSRSTIRSPRSGEKKRLSGSTLKQTRWSRPSRTSTRRPSSSRFHKTARVSARPANKVSLAGRIETSNKEFLRRSEPLR